MPRRSSDFAAGPCPTREDAEDATVEISHEAARKTRAVRSGRPFSRAGSAVRRANHCWDMLRRAPQVASDLETGDDAWPRCRSSSLPTWGSFHGSSRSRPPGKLRAALAQRCSRERAWFLTLRYYADFNYDEIAEALRLLPRSGGRHALRYAPSTAPRDREPQPAAPHPTTGERRWRFTSMRPNACCGISMVRPRQLARRRALRSYCRLRRLPGTA